MTNPSPTVSVAIPLYRSGRFLDIIAENIKVLPENDIEIILSDRHGDTETINRLQNLFAHDPRVRFLQADDQIGWVDHYNWLLTQATGRYFMWMPHDDTFPAGYVSALVNDLKANPTAWLSFGDILAVDLIPNTQQRMYMPRRFRNRLQNWHPIMAVELLSFWNMGIPMRGIIDRHRVVEQGLFIKKVKNSPDFTDQYWVFGVSLQGQLLYNPHQYCIKRYHANNTHSHWNLNDNFPYSADARRTLLSYIDDAPLSASTARIVKTSLLITAHSKRIYQRFMPSAIRRTIWQRLTGHLRTA